MTPGYYITRKNGSRLNDVVFLTKFVKKVKSCWEWIGCKNHRGYGRVVFDGKNIRAHRLFWILNKSPIPNGLCVLHKCDNPPCVRTSHLFLGTHTDNMRDMIRKGRFIPPPDGRGENNPCCKLSFQMVKEIKLLSGIRKQRDIGKMFGVSQEEVSMIVNGKRWL